MSLGPIRPFACRVFVTSNFFLLARWFCLIFCIKKDIYNFTKVTAGFFVNIFSPLFSC